MRVSQSAFRAALLDPEAAVPEGLRDPAGRPAGRRFDVYRNNVVASLAAALETGFPALRALLGAESFRGLAIAYARAHPPRSPLMMHMGDALPAFLEGFGPLRRFAHLPDLARLELAIRESYHAADAEPVDAAALGRTPPEALAGLRLTLAPALRLVASRHPVGALRRAALEGGPRPAPGPETALVTRPGYDPQVRALGAADAAFVAALSAGAALGDAAGQAAAADPAFTPAAALSALLEGGAIVSIDRKPAP
jgi:hypothetical protein